MCKTLSALLPLQKWLHAPVWSPGPACLHCRLNARSHASHAAGPANCSRGQGLAGLVAAAADCAHRWTACGDIAGEAGFSPQPVVFVRAMRAGAGQAESGKSSGVACVLAWAGTRPCWLGCQVPASGSKKPAMGLGLSRQTNAADAVTLRGVICVQSTHSGTVLAQRAACAALLPSPFQYRSQLPAHFTTLPWLSACPLLLRLCELTIFFGRRLCPSVRQLKTDG